MRGCLGFSWSNQRNGLIYSWSEPLLTSLTCYYQACRFLALLTNSCTWSNQPLITLRWKASALFLLKRWGSCSLLKKRFYQEFWCEMGFEFAALSCTQSRTSTKSLVRSKPMSLNIMHVRAISLSSFRTQHFTALTFARLEILPVYGHTPYLQTFRRCTVVNKSCCQRVKTGNSLTVWKSHSLTLLNFIHEGF